MVPILSLAIAAVYAPKGRYGFPSGNAILPVPTVGTPDIIYSRRVSQSTKKSAHNAEPPHEQFPPHWPATQDEGGDVALGNCRVM